LIKDFSLWFLSLASDKFDMLVTLYKYDTHGRMWYYTIDDREQNLFYQHTLTVSWGKELFSGVTKHFTFDTLAQKDKKIRQILRQKTRTYKILYSYFKPLPGQENLLHDLSAREASHSG